MSEIQVNTVRPVGGTTLTVAGGTTVDITGAGLLQTPEVQGSNLVIDGTGQLELQRNGTQRVLIDASGTTVTGNLTVSGGGVITGDGSGLTGLVGVGVGGSSSTGNLQLQSNSGGANGARDILFLDQNSEKARLYGATGNLAVDTDTLFVDASNNRVGIGTALPASTLDVDGTCTATAFVGPLTGNVTGDVTGNVTGTLQTAAQPNITSTGALTVPSLSVAGNITGSTVGALASSLLPSGSVLQVVEATTVSVTNYHNASDWTDAAGLSVSITPKRSSSRILIFANFLSYIHASSASASWAYARFLRGSTVVTNVGTFHFSSVASANMMQAHLQGSDSSHNSTTSLTYKLQVRASFNMNNTAFHPQVAAVNWSNSNGYSWTTGSIGTAPPSLARITAIEVAV